MQVASIKLNGSNKTATKEHIKHHTIANGVNITHKQHIMVLYQTGKLIKGKHRI